MVSWPDLGNRVTVRYRRPPGSVPPLTDAVGHLLAVDPMVRVQTKTGAVVEFAADDAVALRVLTDAPVRTSAIRALEHAAAAARPAEEHTWLDGWLLRWAHHPLAGVQTGTVLAANSAVPLDISARISAVPAIATWYRDRGLTPWLAIPDRLVTLPPGLAGEHHERVLVRDLQPGPSATPPESPERVVVTDAPDGTRWAGLSLWQLPNDEASARRCQALLDWGAQHGATRSYTEVSGDDDVAAALAGRLGFRPHHGRRYFEARPDGWDTV
ncbi:GCN5 family acetyltransferase [Mycobacterium sp. 1100029.7]|nr:GCN5 family acetyltransferase [Mycobacterium sp. 1100029.7]